MAGWGVIKKRWSYQCIISSSKRVVEFFMWEQSKVDKIGNAQERKSVNHVQRWYFTNQGKGALRLGAETKLIGRDTVKEMRVRKVGWIVQVNRQVSKMMTVIAAGGKARSQEPNLLGVRSLSAHASISLCDATFSTRMYLPLPNPSLCHWPLVKCMALKA